VDRNENLLLNLLGVGLDWGIAEKVLGAGFTLTKLRQATKKELAQHFDGGEVELIWVRAKRKRIPPATVQRLLEECDWKCCVCWDYRKHCPVVIHHIEQHSRTHDDTYDNLVILCLNDHALAHSQWEISQHPLPPPLIRSKKREWVEALADFKAGRRPAPGDERHPEEPHLRLSTDIEPSPPTRSEEAAGWKRSWFIRLKVHNTGQAAARSCLGRLLESTDEQGNQLAGLEPLDLYWARQDKSETHKSLDIQGNGDSAYLDIGQVKEGEDVLTLRVVVPRGHRLAVPPGGTRRSQDLPPGTYYLRIGIFADNAHVDPTWLRVDWRSQYPREGDSSVDSYPCRIEIEEPPFAPQRRQ
jgi:hypothetical protein